MKYLNINKAIESLTWQNNLLQIVQYDYSAGGQINNETEITFVLLAMSKERMYLAPYKGGQKTQDKPICVAPNSESPLYGTEMRKSTCSNCEDSKWIQNEKPNCRESYILYGLNINPQNTDIFALTIHGASIKHLKKFLSDLVVMMSTIEDHATGDHLKIVNTLTIKEEEKYFVPALKPVKIADEKTIVLAEIIAPQICQLVTDTIKFKYERKQQSSYTPQQK